MSNTVDLKKIFGYTWGFMGLPFPEIVIKGLPITRKGSFQGEEFKFDAVDKSLVSDLGVAYYAFNQNGNKVYMPIWLSESDNNALSFLLPNTVISMSNKANIITTQLVNRDGTVKEEISIDDWDIRVRGVMVGQANNYPEAEKQKLVNWYKKRQAFSVQNVRTAICLSNSERVIITDLSFPEIRGFENTQPYELRLVSDTQFSLYIE